MRKTIFFIFVFLTFYLSAMYRLVSLLFLALAEMLLAVGMLVIAHCLKRGITAVFQERTVVKEKQEQYVCCINVVNSGRLPVSRFRIRLLVCYLQEREGIARYLYGSSESGTDEIKFGVRASNCGIVCLELDCLWVYDYLGLFSGRKEVEQEMKLVVLPSGNPLKIDFGSFHEEKRVDAEKTVGQCGDAYSEIRQLREYRMGDSCRHIHWNQSARMDGIWIREYEKEIDSGADLLLEIAVEDWMESGKMDAFYRLLYSMLQGLLQNVYSVKVYWYDGNPKQLAQMEILNERQCQELFFDLYQIDFSKFTENTVNGQLEAYRLLHADSFKLDSQLRWYRGKALIYQFSMENLEQEIAETVFSV